MTGHTSHFKVVHNKHAGATSKRRLASDDGVLEARLAEGLDVVEKREEEAHVLVKRADTTASDSCLTGGFYTGPTIGSTHDALQPLTVSWDASLHCLNSTLVDIYLYAPHNSNPRIHVWSRVRASRGEMDVEIMPRWWNSTESEELQIQIVENGKAPFLSSLPAGPVFTATYAAPSDGSVPTVADTNVVDIGVTNVNDDVNPSSSKGKIAAGVLVPLLFLLLGGAFFLRWKRAKSQASRKAWTEAVDKRMSTISTDWKSVTGKGAQEAIRKSFAAGNRASTFSFTGAGGVPGRPSSQWANDEWNAGADGSLSEKAGSGEGRKTGVGLRNPSALSGGERQSRVSFADGPRPSSESRRTKAFRDSYVPPVPSLPNVTASSTSDAAYGNGNNGYGNEKEGSEEGSGAMSPTQTQGAFSLTPEAIRARIAAGRARSASNASAGSAKGMKGVGSVDIGGDDTAAALAMMRTGAAGASTDDLLFAPPAAPAPAYSSPLASNAPVHGHSYSGGNGMSSPTVSSPVMASIPMPAMQAMPAAMMSPDDMLRAYAERKKSMSAVPASSSSSLSQSAYGVAPGSTYSTASGNGSAYSSAAVNYPAVPQAAAGTGRTLFNGSTVSPQGTGERKERTPSLGFAPGEYDPDFRFEGGEDAYGGMGGDESGNAAGRGAWRG